MNVVRSKRPLRPGEAHTPYRSSDRESWYYVRSGPLGIWCPCKGFEIRRRCRHAAAEAERIGGPDATLESVDAELREDAYGIP